MGAINSIFIYTDPKKEISGQLENVKVIQGNVKIFLRNRISENERFEDAK